MRNPAAVLCSHLRRCSSTELLLYLLLSLSFSFHSVRSKSDSSSGEGELVQWQILTKHNFSSQIRLNPHLLLFVTVPWSGQAQSLMKELTHVVAKKKEEFKSLKLMLVHRNRDRMLADALGATMGVNIIYYHHSLSYKYRGTLRVQNILSSIRYVMSLLPEEIPLKSLTTTEDLTTFLESTDKALLVLEFCGWTPKLMAKVMNNGSKDAFGVPFGTGLFGETNETSSADGKNVQGMENEKITCGVDNQFSGLPGLDDFAPLNETDILEAGKMRSSDGASCTFEEFQQFESSLSNFTNAVREFFLPPERLKFGLVSDRSLISSLGVGDTGSWLMMLYFAGCPSCAKVFKGGSDVKRIIEIHTSPVMELKGDEYGFDPGLPSDRPSVILFIDRSSDSLKIRRKSKEALDVFRELALHDHIPYEMNSQNIVKPQKPSTEAQSSWAVAQHPKLEVSTLSQKLTALKDKISIMVMNEGKHVTLDGVASKLQGSSLQEVLAYVLQQKKERKLSSLAKDVGFQLLSDDIDIKMSEAEVQSLRDLVGSAVDFEKDQVSNVDDTQSKRTKVEHSTEDDEKICDDTSAQLSVKTKDLYQQELVANFEDAKVEGGTISEMEKGLQELHLAGFNCSFFFVDGQFRLFETLAGVLKVPSLVIIDPLQHQHHVYAEEADFSYSSLSGFLHMFLNGSLLPHQCSESVAPNSKEAPLPPFVNQDFHEADSIPRINALTFMELVVGNQSAPLSADNAWKKDVLVLFTSSWCGFCLRTELVIREVYRAFKGFGNMVKTQFRNEKSASTNDGINNTILKLPVIYMMDCIQNDCSSILKSLSKRDLYPSLLLFPAERKEAVSYEGETSVLNIIKFIADQGGDSHWIYKQRGVLWAEAQHGAWNEKPFKDASEPVIYEDVPFSKENHEILLKDRTQTQKLEIENKIRPHIPYDSSGSGPEIVPGCILVATQKLLSIYPFARSKILIVKVNQSTGFQGLIINKLITWDSIQELEEGLESLKEAPLSYGGPVIARGLPLVSLTRQASRDGHPEVLPDIYFLDQWATINLIQNLKLQNRSMTDYWFFVGYSEWGWDQLFDEIADGAWNIVNGTMEQFDWPMT